MAHNPLHNTKRTVGSFFDKESTSEGRQNSTQNEDLVQSLIDEDLIDTSSMFKHTLTIDVKDISSMILLGKEETPNDDLKDKVQEYFKNKQPVKGDVRHYPYLDWHNLPTTIDCRKGKND